MTPPDFDTSEKSRYGAKPIECYLGKHGSTFYRWTSADKTVTLPVGEFTPIPISRDEHEFSNEETAETLEIPVPRDNALAALYIGNPPAQAATMQVYRAHRGDEGLAKQTFTGFVSTARFEESIAVLECVSLGSSLKRQWPPLRMQTPCNHVVYSAGCGAALNFDLITVTTIDGDTVVSNDFTARADGWFRSGRLVTLDGKERRFIVDHVGDTVTLLSPMPGLQSGQQVQAVWGCNRLEGECGPAKHNNLDNHLGWARTPERNPFDGRID